MEELNNHNLEPTKMDIEKAFYKSPIGILEIQAIPDAISAILFVNSWKGNKLDEETIVFQTSDNPVIASCFQELDEYFSGERRDFTFPIAQRGTAFQERVWDELLNIPYGRTISYLELSKRLGDPKVIRAAGTANGNNHINIVVPCHRVIGSNGDLVGYGGDLWRKQWLLEHEGKVANGVQTLF